QDSLDIPIHFTSSEDDDSIEVSLDSVEAEVVGDEEEPTEVFHSPPGLHPQRPGPRSRSPRADVSPNTRAGAAKRSPPKDWEVDNTIVDRAPSGLRLDAAEGSQSPQQEARPFNPDDTIHLTSGDYDMVEGQPPPRRR
ncbi:MAG TPA: hypothetical protein VM580_21855, partial [Labilithrix sp.]|nr:hypothetical protein [Labilithrix sp.]